MRENGGKLNVPLREWVGMVLPFRDGATAVVAAILGVRGRICLVSGVGANGVEEFRTDK